MFLRHLLIFVDFNITIRNTITIRDDQHTYLEYKLPHHLNCTGALTCKVQANGFVKTRTLSPFSLSLHFNGHFPGEPGLAVFIEAKDDGGGGDNWIYKTCKASVKSPPTNQYPVFYRPDALPVVQPTVSKH